MGRENLLATEGVGDQLMHQIVTFDWLFAQTIPEPNSGCQLWMNHMNAETGYGLVMHEGQQILTHRLSYTLAVGPIPLGLYVCHHCDVRLCIRSDHLFAGTQADNMADCRKKWRHAFGEHNGTSVLTEEQVAMILTDPRPATTVAAELGIGHKTASAVRAKETWTHIDVPQSARDVQPRGMSVKGAVLSDSQVLSILADSRPTRAIARSYGVNQHTIWSIKSGETWAHLSREGQINFDMSQREFPRGVAHPMAVLSEAEVIAIYRDERSQRAISRSYNVNQATVGRIKRGKSWAHLTSGLG